MASGETQPLLGTSNEDGRMNGCGDIDKWELPADENEVSKISKDIREHLHFPEAWMLVLVNMGMCVGYSLYVMTSWLYCAAVQRMLFPHCGRVWIDQALTEDVYAIFCKLTTLAFWSLPILCSVLVLSVYYRNVLQSWMYFEMMTHRIHLDYSDISFFHSWTVRYLIVHAVCGMGIYWFYRHSLLLALYRATYTLPYWVPIFSFGGMLYASWDLKKTQLVSLAKVVQTDLPWAQNEMSKTYMIRDYVAEQAWLTIKQRRPKPRTSTELFRALTAECARLEQTQSVKPKTLFIIEVLSLRYWINEIIEELEIDDERIRKFRWYFRAFKIFVIIMGVLLTYVACVTIFTVLEEDIGKPLLGEYSWYFSARPLGDLAGNLPSGSHQAIPTTSTMTTTAGLVADVAARLGVEPPPGDKSDIAIATWKLGGVWSLRHQAVYPHGVGPHGH